MKVVVMGAGLAGVTTAWFLAKDGHEVVVVDREPEVARAASYANGGVFAASRGYPWPAEGLAMAIVRSLLRFDPTLWRWGMAHLRERPNYSRILEAKVRVLRYSQAQLHALLAETAIGYGRITNGVFYIYRSAEALERGWQRAEVMRRWGFILKRLDSESVKEKEPSIDSSQVAGAIYAPGDEAGDSRQFCLALAERCGERGVAFRMQCSISALESDGVHVREIVTSQGRISGDAFVCALGAIEAGLGRHMGVRVPVYPVKGYSATVPLRKRIAHPAIDESRSVLYSPLGNELRITGGAEFVGHARGHRPADFRPMYDAVESLFPGAADFAAARTWDCRRPMTPETTPRYGKGRFENLWFNIGGGHMGWAMAAAGGRITADLVAGRAPGISLEGLGMRRG
ncbi:MAG TPA: FAD-dependent oxidoreductase [Burkholderiales bacterium]|nr:FAD-dependent oxidoreductase [Burkholderiales bacterium]